MYGSWHIGRLAGIDVRIHWTFLLLPIWIYFSTLFAGSGAAAAAISVLFVLAIFGCVVLHELGHALAARYFGIGTHDITLLPIGGLARLERMPTRPGQELAIAVAGPLVNVVIAGVIFAFLAAGGGAIVSLVGATGFVTQLAIVNVALVVFNMIPAFPLDGGRVLRAVLAMFLPYGSATRAAAAVGQVAAVGLGILGLAAGNFILLLIAGFIFLAARSESSYVTSTEKSQFVPRFQPRTGSFVIGENSRPVLDASWTADWAAKWVSNQPMVEYAVAKNGSIIGFIGKSEIIRAILAGYGAVPVEQLMNMRFDAA